jgi:uncharacterized membrane protein (DUF485 family)
MSTPRSSAVPPRLGAAAAIAGALLLVPATMLHPMGADPSDAAAAFAEYADDKRWVASHLGQFFGVVLMFVGLTAFADTLRESPWAWLARLGVYFGVAALAGAAVLQAVDGVALKRMVDAWAAAPVDQRQSALSASLAVRHIEIGAAAYSRLLYGIAVSAFSCASVASAKYPNWLACLGLAGGLGTFVAGILTAYTGFSATTMAVGMAADLIVMAWICIASYLMWRQSV